MSGIGKLLQDARRRKGFTLDDVERETRIRKRYLLALEQDDSENLPQPVYAAGFLRVYARFLDLDAAELARRYAAGTGAPPAAAPVQFAAASTRPRRPDVERRRAPVGTMLLAGMALAAAVLTYGRLKEPAAELFSQAQPAAPAIAPAASKSAPAAGAPENRAVALPRIPAAPVPATAGGGERSAAASAVTSAPRLIMAPPWFQTLPETSSAARQPGPLMPMFIGSMASDVRRTLDGLGLAVVVESWASSERPAGVVLWQRPEAGAATDRAQPVVLAVSRGPLRVTVPEVAGKPHDEATRALQQAGLITPPVMRLQGPKDLSPAALTSVCNGCVLSIAPPPGAELPPDGIVVLAVRQD